MALDFPASPSNGQVFTSGGVSWTFDGDKWKVSSSSIEPVFISSSTPTGVAGQIYWDSDESTAYIYYDDGNTAQWVPLVSTAPVSFDTSAIVSGTLPVARGGTGTTSFDAGKIAEGNTEAEVVDTGSDGHFKVTTEGTERLKIDNSGRLLLGTSSHSSIDNFVVEGHATDGTSAAFMMLRRGSANPSGGLGFVRFADSNGGVGAQIQAETDGTWASNDYPTSLRFSTTADGASSPTERVRIDSSGRLILYGSYEQTAEAVSALNIDCSTGNFFTKAISTSSTFTFSNVPSSGTAYAFTLEIDVTGTSTAITWPSSVKFPGDTAPTLTDTKTHLFMFVTNDGGTTFRGSSLVDYTT